MTKSSSLVKPSSLAVAFVIFASPANAASVISSSFNPLTNGAVVTTGTLDWGFVSQQGALNNGLFNGSGGAYNNLAYGSLDNSSTVLTTVSGSSGIGAVTVTEGQGADGSTNFSAITFDATQAYGGFRSVAPSEDVFTINFNDLGVGTFDIRLYLGHSSATRNFRMNYSLVDGAPISGFTNSGSISGLGSTVTFSTGVAFTYDIQVETDNADADLSLNFVSLSGGSGDGLFAGYTVTGDAPPPGPVIPEPGSALLGFLGLAGLLRRRR